MQGRPLKSCLKEKQDKRDALLDWIWRSANQPLFMTLDCTDGPVEDGEDHRIDGRNCWVDGGVRENIPLLRAVQYVFENGSKFPGTPAIDVVINNRQIIDLDPLTKRRVLTSLFRAMGILTFDVRDNDVNLPAEMEKAYRLEMDKQGVSMEEDDPVVVTTGGACRKNLSLYVGNLPSPQRCFTYLKYLVVIQK